MATIFDIGLWDVIQPIFVFLLVFAVLFGVLSKINFFGKNNWVNSFIAIITAFLFTLMPAGREMISFILPWFVILVLLLLVMFGLFMFAGVKEESIIKFATNNAAFITMIIVIVLVVFLIGISKMYGPIFQAAGAEEIGWWASTKRVVFSPTFLGVIFFIVIVSYAVRALSTKG